MSVAQQIDVKMIQAHIMTNRWLSRYRLWQRAVGEAYLQMQTSFEGDGGELKQFILQRETLFSPTVDESGSGERKTISYLHEDGFEGDESS